MALPPGRGAWTTTGGLLPARPGTDGGYYRAPTDGEATPGAAGKRLDADHNAQVVTEAVRAIQRLLRAVTIQNNLPAASIAIDGLFGPRTGAAAVAVQGHYGLITDGIIGPATMRALLQPLLDETTDRYTLPPWVLPGIAGKESQLDPGAVGQTTPDDVGLVQVNRAAHPRVTLRQAIDPRWALDWTAARIRREIDRWTSATAVDPVDIAVATHNSPAQAQQWAKQGTPTTHIADYVAKVKQIGGAS